MSNLRRLSLVLAFVALLGVLTPSIYAAFSVSITTPTTGTQFDSLAKFDVNGTSDWFYLTDGNPDYIYLRVTDTDNTTIIVAVNADLNFGTGNWTQPDDAQGESKIHAPAGSPPNIIESFSILADIYKDENSQADAARQLKVKGPDMP